MAGRPQEAGLSLEAEFPSLITHPLEQQDQAAFLCLFLDRAYWQVGRRLRVFASYLLEHLCYPAHVAMADRPAMVQAEFGQVRKEGDRGDGRGGVDELGSEGRS